MHIKLDFDEELLATYAQRGSPLLFQIAWEHDGDWYPDKDWMDFGGVIIGWWLVAMVNLLHGLDEEEFMFMDGPFSIYARYNRDNGLVMLKPKKECIIWHVHIYDIAQELVHGATVVKSELTRRGIGTDQCISLDRGITTLSAALLRYKAANESTV